MLNTGGIKLENYLVIDFAKCGFSVKALTDKEIAETDESVVRFNKEQGVFEECVSSIVLKDEDENIVGCKLLWVDVNASPHEYEPMLKNFFMENK
jgi:hypothetical protein